MYKTNITCVQNGICTKLVQCFYFEQIFLFEFCNFKVIFEFNETYVSKTYVHIQKSWGLRKRIFI